MKRANRIAVVMAMAAACDNNGGSADHAGRVKQRVTELGFSSAKVRCPERIEAKRGEQFECSIDLGGRLFVLVATITEEGGKQLGMDTRWKNGTAVVTSKVVPEVATMLSKQYDAKVKVFCGTDPILFLDQGNLHCQLAAGEVSAKLAVAFDDKLAPITWKLDPPLLARSKLEAVLTPRVREKLDASTTVTCGDNPLLPRPVGGEMICKLTLDNALVGSIAVELDENLDITRWSLL